jgi:hypothetical protein
MNDPQKCTKPNHFVRAISWIVLVPLSLEAAPVGHLRQKKLRAAYAAASAVLSTIGRTSTVPSRAEGIRAAILRAASRFFASIRK